RVEQQPTAEFQVTLAAVAEISVRDQDAYAAARHDPAQALLHVQQTNLLRLRFAPRAGFLGVDERKTRQRLGALLYDACSEGRVAQGDVVSALVLEGLEQGVHHLDIRQTPI